jgi:fibronectin type 3 domain-containing protein
MPNPDEDIYGYRVFRSASGNNEFSQRTHRPVPDTFFIDTLSTKDLNASVFYKIVAIDQRQNQSGFSKVAELVKPDGIPPSIPVIQNTRATREGVVLEWVNSTSPDVEKHIIYRFTKGDSAWVAIAEIPHKKAEERGTYTDGDCSVDRANQYKIMAVDKSGNLSQPSLSIAIKGLRDNRAEGLKKIGKQVDREKGKLQLTWQLPEKAIKYIKIYRKSGGDNYALFTTLEGDQTSFLDHRLKLGRTYAYRVKLNYMDGTVSGFSDEIKVEF